MLQFSQILLERRPKFDLMTGIRVKDDSVTWLEREPHWRESRRWYPCSTYQALFLDSRTCFNVSFLLYFPFKTFLFGLFKLPMAASFFGFAVRSFPSPLRAFPLQTFEYVNSCTSLYWSTYVSKFLYPARMLHYCVAIFFFSKFLYPACIL